MRKPLGICLLFSLMQSAVTAQYRLSTSCKQAYTSLWQYNIAEAENHIKAAQQENPENIFHIYLLTEKWFIQTFVTEESGYYKQFQQQSKIALEKIEAGEYGSPFYYNCKSTIYLHSALLELKFAEYASAAWNIKKAYTLIKEGNKKYPDFLPLRRNLLVLQALVGTVPENYQWMLKVFGFDGELKPAMNQLAQVVSAIQKSEEFNFLSSETQIIYAFLLHHLLNETDAAWKIMESVTNDYSQSPVSAFARANLAMHQKKNAIALQALSSCKNNIPAIQHLDYMYGIAKLQHGDSDAGFYLGRYIKHFKGKNYIKDAYLKLAWAFLLNNDTKNYFNSLKLIQYYGVAYTEDDKNALRESKSAILPSIPMLKARLLYDGGNYANALSQLNSVKPNSLSKNQRAEFYYRRGRIEEARGNFEEALQDYGTVIEKFGSLALYFAPASCFYSGMIWEKKQNTAKATFFYRKCRQYKDYVYKNSFDQKALSGLERLQ